MESPKRASALIRRTFFRFALVRWSFAAGRPEAAVTRPSISEATAPVEEIKVATADGQTVVAARIRSGGGCGSRPDARIRGSKSSEWSATFATRTSTRQSSPQLYVPHRLNRQVPMSFVVRSYSAPANLAAPMRRVLREVDPELPIYDVRHDAPGDPRGPRRHRCAELVSRTTNLDVGCPTTPIF